jgi:hypothetical protein
MKKNTKMLSGAQKTEGKKIHVQALFSEVPSLQLSVIA